MALQNGNVIYLYTIPYKPSKVERSYRCIGTKTDLDFSEEIKTLQEFWKKNDILFDYEACMLYEGVKGRNNVAYEVLPQVLDSYERYNPDKSLAKVNDEVEDFY